MRCKINAKSVLNKYGVKFFITDGVIAFHDDLTQDQLNDIKSNLKNMGMHILNEPDSLVIDKVITSINEVIHDSDQLPNIMFDDIINKKIVLGSDHILKIFSEIKGVTILQYIVIQKIEKVKELLLYSDLSLSEIAKKLNYKNENYLVAQLKKVTGLTPDYFREIKRKRDNKIRQNATP